MDEEVLIMENIGKLNAAIYRNLQGILNAKLRDIPIKSGQYDFFYVISLREGITQKELSEWLYVGKSTTAKVVKNLMAHGYVRKEKNAGDKRYESLYLTEAGRQLAPRMHETFLQIVEVTTKRLSEKEAAQTTELLKKILQNVSDEKAKMTADADDALELL